MCHDYTDIIVNQFIFIFTSGPVHHENFCGQENIRIMLSGFDVFLIIIKRSLVQWVLPLLIYWESHTVPIFQKVANFGEFYFNELKTPLPII